MTTRLNILALIGLCLCVALAGCGRKGALDNPAAPVSADSEAVDPADAPLPAAEPQGEKEPFFLDFLIN